MLTDSTDQWIFETVDYKRIPVVLSRMTWHAKAGDKQEEGTHPEIRDYLNDIKNAIESPDLVFQSQRDDRSRIFYILNAGRGRFYRKTSCCGSKIC